MTKPEMEYKCETCIKILILMEMNITDYDAIHTKGELNAYPQSILKRGHAT